MEVAKYISTRYGKGSIEYHTAVPPQRSDGEAAQIRPKRWKALAKWRAQIHRYCLTRMRKHLALITKHIFGYVRLIGFTIRISRRRLFHKPALPYGTITQAVHDRRYALFRRRAVLKSFRMLRTRKRGIRGSVSR